VVRAAFHVRFHSLCVLYRSGTVESKIRQLVMKLEYVETVVVAHPFVKGFEDTCYCLSAEELRTVSEGTISPEVRARTKADIEGKEGACTVYSTNFFIGLAIEPKQGRPLPFMALKMCPYLPANASGPRRLDISYPTSEFTKMVKMWDQYVDEKMSIVVRIIKRFVLWSSKNVCSHNLLRAAPCSLTMCSMPASASLQKLSSEQRYVLRIVAHHVNPYLGQAPNFEADGPNKRRKSVLTAYPYDPWLIYFGRSTNAVETVVPANPPKFVHNISPVNPLVDPPLPSEGIYAPGVKVAADIKTPQLPAGENAALASGFPGLS
jgi:hypothetical protein